MRRRIRLTENDIRNIVKRSVSRVISEGWNDDRFEYEHFTDEGNGGIEEYGHNIYSILEGMDSDSLHAIGEEVASNFGENGKRELKCFIEGLISVYKNPKDPYEVYDKYGIERN